MGYPAGYTAAVIDGALSRERRRYGKYNPQSIYGRARDIAMKPGFCLVCGQQMDCLVTPHVEKHGYTNKQDFIAAGLYKPYEFKNVFDKETEVTK